MSEGRATVLWRRLLTTAADLRDLDVEILMHDAHIDHDEVMFDAAVGVVTVPFDIEPKQLPEGIAKPDLPRKPKPWLRCYMRIEQAVELTFDRGRRGDDESWGFLDGIAYDDRRGRLALEGTIARDLVVRTSALRAELVVTDEVRHH